MRWPGIAGDASPPLSRASFSARARSQAIGREKTIHRAANYRRLPQGAAGLPVKVLCARHGSSEANPYLWRSRLGIVSTSDAKGLTELEADHDRVKM